MTLLSIYVYVYKFIYIEDVCTYRQNWEWVDTKVVQIVGVAGL